MANNCVSCGATDGVDEINTQVPQCNGCKITASPYATDSGVQPICAVYTSNKTMCSCNQPSSSCTCGNVTSPVPAPYYQCAPICQEDHQKVVVNNNFAASLKGNNSWNVPSCGNAAIVTVVGLTQLQIGSNFFHPLYGYYQVIQFNSSNGQVTLQNNCVTGNATVGSAIPAGTEFIVTPPPISQGGGQLPTVYPYLAVDFTAPANAVCIAITVTTTQGIAVNKNVQIGSGTYRVSAVTDGTHITICNDGTGAVPGTAVLARNAAGEYQYPIILIDTNPCTNTPVATGAILVCKDGLSQPLDATVVGAIPVVTNIETNEVEYRVLNLPTATCSTIPCCLTLVAGIANYAIQVSDSSQFVVGDILQIGSRTDRFTISSIPNATTLVGTMSPTPASTVTIAVGTTICVIGCCEDLQNQVTAIDTRIDAITDVIGLPTTNCSLANAVYSAGSGQVDEDAGTASAPANITTGGSRTGNTQEFRIQNTSTCRNMLVLGILNYNFDVSIQPAGAGVELGQIDKVLGYNTALGTISSPPVAPAVAFAANGEIDARITSNSNILAVYSTEQRSVIYTLAPQEELVVVIAPRVQFTATASTVLQFVRLQTSYQLIKVAT